MPAISMQDLENAKTDVDHIAAVATSLDPTATDRLGHVKQTLAGAVGSIAAITDRGAWASGEAYLIKDIVTVAGVVYVCVSGHTAGATFAGDSAKWRVYQGLTVAEFDAFVADLANNADPAKGAGSVGRATQVVETIAALRNLSKSYASKHALISRYYVDGPVVNSLYAYDSSDTTSADNGGDVVVAADGGRWKLQSNGCVSAMQFGAKGDGSTNDTQRFAVLKDYAASSKARVLVNSGTYILDAGTDLTANNTDWYFDSGATLKLVNTQATTSFIVFNAPINQNVYGLKVDANREVQDPVLFGEDNCAVIVIDAKECNFHTPSVVSSPAKGFVLVSTPGGTTRDVAVNGFSGGNCAQQVCNVDGNNMTGLFERVVINGVLIKATSHAGLTLNDGVHNVCVSNVISDIQNPVHDAVSVRDSYDLQFSNIRGSNGRAGFSVERLNGYTGRIQLDNVTGEFNTQNGVLFLGAEDITGGVVVGRSNGGVGVNIAATSGGYKSKNILISAPAAFDDQTTKTQDFGLLVQGVTSCRIGKLISYGNTVKNVSVIRAETSDVDIDIKQTASGSTGSVPASGELSVTLAWPQPFEDAEIDIISAYVEVGTGSIALSVAQIIGITASNVMVMVKNLNGTTPFTGTLRVIGSRRV